jgi:hypothetical protein
MIYLMTVYSVECRIITHFKESWRKLSCPNRVPNPEAIFRNFLEALRKTTTYFYVDETGYFSRYSNVLRAGRQELESQQG